MKCRETEVSNLHVLVVDDDPEIREIHRNALALDGYRVTEAADVTTALSLLRSEQQFDLVLLDLGLPDASGYKILSAITEKGSLPVIVVSGYGDESDRVLGLELGADDYLPKPFSPREVRARVKAVLRRNQPLHATSGQLDCGELHLDVDKRRVTLNGNAVELTAREFQLLHFLMMNAGRVWTSEELLAQVWDSSIDWQSPNTVREHVYRLRQKVENEPNNPRHLLTVRGVGYLFES